MHPVDLGRIRGDSAPGRRASFEHLICHLARGEAQNRATFRRIYGAGGDAGVECVHRDGSGRLVGYQAKYYTRPGDIDWAAIDQSVAAATSAYPDLAKYVVAIASPFTGRKRGAAGSQSQGTWARWDARVARWNKGRRRRISFVVWTEDEILHRLLAPGAEGVRAYWFGDLDLSGAWFEECGDQAIRAVDERYHSDDHVQVGAAVIFDFLARNSQARAVVAGHFRKLHELWQGVHSLRVAAKLKGELVDALATTVSHLTQREADLDVASCVPWDVVEWKNLAGRMTDNAVALQRWIADVRALPSEARAVAAYEVVKADLQLGLLIDALGSFRTLLGSPAAAAATSRVILLEGRAGTGKSHLLASTLRRFNRDGVPAILLLGDHFRDAPPWQQILERLDLRSTSAQEFLAALDVIAERGTSRALILIDGLNEGAGARLWLRELSSFLATLEKYPHVACALSCRSEYVKRLVPAGTLKALARLELRGFTSPEEQEQAARVYLDRRGIARPATPWLAPEFSNPLFLRSCCEALRLRGKTEFPKGLLGTKSILSFYIESAARYLGTDRDGSDDLVQPTKDALLRLASAMAANRQACVGRSAAERLTDECFRQFSPPPTMTWLQVLHRNGLVRIDPDSAHTPADPLAPIAEVIRFGFQRFQDHLMAEALLRDLGDIKSAFADAGTLAFLRRGGELRWEWRGLVGALATQVPEAFGVELVDVLPGGARSWWSNEIQEAFVESIRWRSPGAFSDRTLALLNSLFRAHVDPVTLLFEVALSSEHPWNADFLHRTLERQRLPVRDAFWTVALNKSVSGDSHPAHRLIDWCLRIAEIRTERDTVRLSALCLAWCLTSTNRILRDRATKALTALLVSYPDMFAVLVTSFERVDDLYVTERVFGAAYGACCLDPTGDRLRSYAEIAASAVFLKPAPPDNLMLRDYAYGIVELAGHQRALPATIDVARCKPPYNSSPVKLAVTKPALESLAARAGDDTIARSCAGGFGDFGHYKIEPLVRNFVRVTLSAAPPLTARERFARFVEEVVGTDTKKRKALERLESAGSALAAVRSPTRPSSTKKAVQPNESADAAERNFLALLRPSERRRFKTVAPFSRLNSGRRDPKAPAIDADAAARWVAGRAYRLGWTQTRFPSDGQEWYSPSDNRPLVERIGKKYQWLALNELLCRLADNYWLGGIAADGTRQYAYPTDVGFLRDIDPTVLPRPGKEDTSQSERAAWVFGSPLGTSTCSDAELETWPYTSDLVQGIPALVHRRSPDRRTWVTLHHHQSVDARHAQELSRAHHNFRTQEFRISLAIIVPAQKQRQLIAHTKVRQSVDIASWDPIEVIDGPFLFESPWRATWPTARWQEDGSSTPRGLRLALPTCRWVWESHLDASLRNGARAFVPSPWLAELLGLQPLATDASTWCDQKGIPRFISSCGAVGGSSILVDADLLTAALRKEGLRCVWAFVAERTAWPASGRALWRRTEGLTWKEGRFPKMLSWTHDGKQEP